MKRKRFSVEQIAYAISQLESGTAVGRGAAARLAEQVQRHPRSLRQEVIQLLRRHTTGLHPALVQAPVPTEFRDLK